MKDEDLSHLITNLNAVSLPQDRIARMLPLVTDVNARIRLAADARLTIDATPWSFLTFRGRDRGDAS